MRWAIQAIRMRCILRQTSVVDSRLRGNDGALVRYRKWWISAYTGVTVSSTLESHPNLQCCHSEASEAKNHCIS